MTEKRIEEKTFGELEATIQSSATIQGSSDGSKTLSVPKASSVSKASVDYNPVLKERAWHERLLGKFREKSEQQSRDLTYITETLTGRLYGSAEEQGLLPKLKITLEEQHRCALELTLVQSYVKAIGEIKMEQLSTDPLVLAYLNTAHQIRFKQFEKEKDDLTARLESYNVRAGDYLQKIEAAEPLLAAAKKELHGLVQKGKYEPKSDGKK
ncbi:hypothetical protein J4437_04965 [Candidatus Woesearchaeota archaeon]|nr:hypothetical protein [Candidatus Woesearchaeota archaeon]